MNLHRKTFGLILALIICVAGAFAGEVYRLSWTQSPSTFLETQKVMATINGGPPQQLGTDLLANVSQVEFEFTSNATANWWIVSIGDNASTAESVHWTFTAANQATILPATGGQSVFVRHVD